MKKILLIMLLIAARPGQGFEIKSDWRKEFSASTISAWGFRFISATDFLVVGNIREKSLLDSSCVYIQRMNIQGDSLWRLNVKLANTLLALPSERHIEILPQEGNIFALICQVIDSGSIFGIGVFRFNASGVLLSKKVVARNFIVRGITQDGKNVYVSGARSLHPPSNESTGKIFKFDMQMQSLDSTELQDSTDCTSNRSFNIVNGIAMTNDGIQIAGRQECYKEGANGPVYYSGHLYATLGTDLKIKKSRKIVLPSEFQITGLSPLGGDALIYGYVSGAWPDYEHRLVRTNVDSTIWNWVVGDKSSIFEDHVNITEKGALLWFGYYGNCYLMDPASGKKLDSAQSDDFGKIHQSIRVAENEYVLLSNGTYMALEKVHLENVPLTIRRHLAPVLSSIFQFGYKLNGQRVHRKNKVPTLKKFIR